MEETRNEIMVGMNFIVNITEVQILPYSNNSDKVPQKSKIVGIDEGTLSYTPGTSFNLLTSFDLKITEKINDNSEITDEEKSLLETTMFLICEMRSDLIVNEMEVSTEYSILEKDVYFFFPVYLQEKKFTLTNIHSTIQGRLVRSLHTGNIYIENIDLEFSRNLGGIQVGGQCNYPEANVNEYIYVNNVTAYYKIKRLTSLTFGSVLAHTGPGDLISSNIHSTIYYRNEESKVTTGIGFVGDWAVDITDKPRYWNVSDSSFVLNERSGGSYNLLGGNLQGAGSRRTIITFNNIDFTEYINSFFPAIYLIQGTLAEIYENGLKFNHSSTIYPLILYVGIGKVEISRLYMEQTDSSNTYFYQIFYIGTVVIKDITLHNVQLNDVKSEAIFYVVTLPAGSLTMSNITLKDSYFGFRNLVSYASSWASSLSVTSISCSNVTLNTGSSIIKSQYLTSLVFSNSSFSGLVQSNSGDFTNKMLNIISLDLRSNSQFLISSVKASKSSVAMLYIGGIANTLSGGQVLRIDNWTYENSNFEFSQKLMTFGSIQVEINNLQMYNLTFPRTGHLLYLTHQLSTPLYLTNSQFELVKGGSIYIQSADLKNSTLNTRVSMINITASDISSGTSSFILNREGGKLVIEESTFVKMDSTESGSVINAGYQNSETLIHNSTFTNNTSIYGGVANVQDRSVIKFYNCTIENNFAIQSGVIQSSNGGYFEFYNSYILKNLALTIPISEVFIVSNVPIINNSTLSGNYIVSKQQIISMISKCSSLCFSPEYAEYISNNLYLLDQSSLEYGIQLISGTISIENNTLITNQPNFINSYLSTVNISDTSFEDIQADGNILEFLSSTVNLVNI
jgi:hypothetical protein